MTVCFQGRSQDFPKGGSHCVKHYRMAFSPWNIVGCFLKKMLTKGGGGGHGHPRTTLATSLVSMTTVFPVDACDTICTYKDIDKVQ